MPTSTAERVHSTPETDTCRHCHACNGVMRWLTTPAAVRRARHWDHPGDRPPTATPLHCLRRLGHTGALTTRLQTSPAIQTLLQRQEVAR